MNTYMPKIRIKERPIYYFIPALIVLTILAVYPILNNVSLSLTNKSGAFSLANYQRLFKDKWFWNAMLNTGKWAAFYGIHGNGCGHDHGLFDEYASQGSVIVSFAVNHSLDDAGDCHLCGVEMDVQQRFRHFNLCHQHRLWHCI